jgi:hypothetical protein
MATPRNLFAHKTSDYGFDSDPRLDQSPTADLADYGFDEPLEMEPEQPWTDTAPLRGSKDCGIDAPLASKALQSTGIGVAPLPEAQGDEDHEMDVAPTHEAHGPSRSSPKASGKP